MILVNKLFLLLIAFSMTGCISFHIEERQGPYCTTGSYVGAATGAVVGAKFAGKGKGKILTGIGGALAGAMIGESVCHAYRENHGY